MKRELESSSLVDFWQLLVNPKDSCTGSLELVLGLKLVVASRFSLFVLLYLDESALPERFLKSEMSEMASVGRQALLLLLLFALVESQNLRSHAAPRSASSAKLQTGAFLSELLPRADEYVDDEENPDFAHHELLLKALRSTRSSASVVYDIEHQNFSYTLRMEADVLSNVFSLDDASRHLHSFGGDRGEKVVFRDDDE